MTVITASRPEFAKALSLGASIVGASPIDVANNVFLSVAKGRAELLFTDLDIWLGRSLSASADAITATTIPASLFARAAQGLEGDTLTIDLTPGNATLKAGRARLRLRTLPVDNFPRPRDDEARDEHCVVNAAALGGAIERVAYASPSDGAVQICGVHFAADIGGQLDLATYDGKRMGYDCVINSGGEQDPFNLPLKAARTLAKLCSESPDSDVTFSATERMATFACGAWTLRSKLIEVAFAPFRKVVDATIEDPAIIDRKALDRALGRLALLSDRHWNGVRVTLTTDKLTVALASDKTGDAVEEISIDYNGPDRTAGYNIIFLRDAVQHAQADEIQLCVSAQLNGTVRSIEEAGDPSIHSFAPFNLKETINGQHA